VIVPEVDAFPVREHLVTPFGIGLVVVAEDREAVEVGERAAGLAGGVFGLSLVLGAGEPLADTSKPKYGGTLEVGTVYITLSALSWDPQDARDQAALTRQLPVQELIALLAAKGLRQASARPTSS